jgi:hypothetical protein
MIIFVFVDAAAVIINEINDLDEPTAAPATDDPPLVISASLRIGRFRCTYYFLCLCNGNAMLSNVVQIPVVPSKRHATDCTPKGRTEKLDPTLIRANGEREHW